VSCDIPAPGGPMRTNLGAGPEFPPRPIASLAVCTADLAESTVEVSSCDIFCCSCHNVITSALHTPTRTATKNKTDPPLGEHWFVSWVM
jgi:hypothetical protein